MQAVRLAMMSPTAVAVVDSRVGPRPRGHSRSWVFSRCWAADARGAETSNSASLVRSVDAPVGAAHGSAHPVAAQPQIACRSYCGVPRSHRTARLGLLSCRWPRVERLRDFTGRSEGQKAGEKNAFLFLEDQNQKYFPPRIEADERAGGSANPNSRCSPFCPSDLPVKKSRSCEVARSRQGSFCDSGCTSAARAR